MRNVIGGLAILTAPVVALALVPSSQGRQQSPVSVEKGQGGVVQQFQDLCGLNCKVLADGEASISGNAKIDAFFGATLNFQAQAASLKADVKAELVSIAAAAGVEGAADLSVDELVAQIDAEVKGGFNGMIDGGLTIEFAPPKCEVTAQASVEAAASCDAKATPPQATVECSGNCEASADVMAECSGSAELKCKGTAPSFECSGTCTGECDLEAGGECGGTCDGKCTMDGTAACDGECMGSTDAGGNCDGECKLNAGASCTGSCEGKCDLKAGGSCSGQCKGECEYTPPSGSCEAGATAKCEAKADASVECSGKCDGDVTPPMVSAECEATAKANAKASAECTPPSVDLKYTLSASAQADFQGDATAQAAFEGRIQAVGKAFANLVAKGAKVEAIASASPGLIKASTDAVASAVSDLSGSADARGAFGAFCATSELPKAGTILKDSAKSLTDTAAAVASVTGTFTGA